MDASALEAALATLLPKELAKDLVEEFLDVRADVATQTLGRAAPGKVVETVVQACQAIENNGTYDAQPQVEKYLTGLESRTSSLPDGLRICAARVCRAMYALRSKRNIVHKADVDPSLYDLHFLYAGSQWVIAELLALASGISGQEAGRLVSQVQAPSDGLVEAIDDRKIVHADMPIPEEVLVVLMQDYPTPVPASTVVKSLDRRSPGSVTNAIRDLWRTKQIHRGSDKKIVLTQQGLRQAVAIAKAHMA
jgi:hypothetical protein